MRGLSDPRDLRVLPDLLVRRVSGVHRGLEGRVLLDPRALQDRKDPPDLQVLTALTVPMEHRARRASRGPKGLKGRRDPQARPGLRAQRDREGSTWTTPPEH